MTTVELSKHHQLVETDISSLSFTLPERFEQRATLFQVAQEQNGPIVEQLEPTVEQAESQSVTTAQELEQQVLSAAEKSSNQFKQNIRLTAELGVGALRLAGAIGSMVKLAAAACPHCAAIAVQSASSVQSAFSFGGLGHWHADGTYHEGEHHGNENTDNPFKWLEVDDKPSMFQYAA